MNTAVIIIYSEIYRAQLPIDLRLGDNPISIKAKTPQPDGINDRAIWKVRFL